MKARISFANFVMMTGAIILAGATISQDAVAKPDSKHFIGSWVVVISPSQPGPPSFLNLATINRDGTMIVSDPVVGGGHGVWKKLGKRDFEMKFLTLVPPVFPAGTLPPFLGEFHSQSYGVRDGRQERRRSQWGGYR